MIYSRFIFRAFAHWRQFGFSMNAVIDESQENRVMVVFRIYESKTEYQNAPGSLGKQ